MKRINFNTIYPYTIAFVVFYLRGWNAFLDGRKNPIYKTNYVVRGAFTLTGKKNIKFEFRPDTYYKGEWIGIIAIASAWVLLLLADIMEFHKSKSHL